MMNVRKAIVAMAALMMLIAYCFADEEGFAKARLRLVDLIRDQGIKDENVLKAMSAVPRHFFVPPSLSNMAYLDIPLPIDEGQSISQPYIVAFMTEQAKIKPGDKVLEVGTGSGYQAAVLAQMGAEVYTIEIIPSLAKSAEQRLKQLNFKKIAVRCGDGYKGWPEKAPFAAIIVTAAPNHVPKPLIDQLAVGGRLVIPIGPEGGIQSLKIITKTAEGMTVSDVMPVRFVPMTGEGVKEKK